MIKYSRIFLERKSRSFHVAQQWSSLSIYERFCVFFFCFFSVIQSAFIYNSLIILTAIRILLQGSSSSSLLLQYDLLFEQWIIVGMNYHFIPIMNHSILLVNDSSKNAFCLIKYAIYQTHSTSPTIPPPPLHDQGNWAETNQKFSFVWLSMTMCSSFGE